MTIIWIGLAGMLGALSRYFMGVVLLPFNGSAFPYATFVCNVLGSFLLGWLYTRVGKSSPVWRNVIGVGFIGSFTTFSTFSIETVLLIQTGQLFMAFCYVALSFLLGLVMVYLGYKLASRSTASTKEERA